MIPVDSDGFDFYERLGVSVDLVSHIDEFEGWIQSLIAIREFNHFMRDMIVIYWALCYKYKHNRFISSQDRAFAKITSKKLEHLYLDATFKRRNMTRETQPRLPGGYTIVTADKEEASLLAHLRIPHQLVSIDHLASISNPMSEQEMKIIEERIQARKKLAPIAARGEFITADEEEARLFSKLGINHKLVPSEELPAS